MIRRSASDRLLGNGYGTALVRHDGTVDWWCAPGLDSPPLLWGLLDAKGPVAAWTGAVAVGRTSTVAGPGLRTTVAALGIQFQLLDGLVHVDGAAVLARADAMVAVLDGLQAEEVDPDTGAALGNIPLVWCHTEAARAARLLDRAARRT